MIEQNKSEFEKSNILLWRSKGYTGKGSTIVVLDTPHKPYPHTNVIDPLNDNMDSYGHKAQVAQVIREIAVESDIVVFSWTRSKKQEIIDWIKEHKSEIDVINVSLAISTSLDMFDKLKDFDIPVIVSTGNGSKDEIQKASAYDWTMAVGAWQEHNDRKATYSNYGTNLDGVAYTNIHITTTSKTNTLNFNGTSCSAPVTSSLIAIYNQWRRDNGIKKMTRNEAREFLHNNALDKKEKGYDITSGHGVFRLPSEIPTLPKYDEVPEEAVHDVPKLEEPKVEVISGVKLIIDAGHGGLDTGGYFNGYLEKYLTLVVARRVKQLLKQYNPAMTREDDISIVWNDRANIIKDKYDYCISIHFNIGGGVGVEAIHSAFTTKGKLLASELVNAISEATGIPKRPTPIFSKKNSAGQDYYYMHRLTGTTTTVIVECLFMDAPNEVDIDKLNLEKIAEGIAKGFMKFAGQPVVVLPLSNPYKVIRKYNSNIHVYEVDKSKKVDFDLGVRFRLEKVSDIIKPKLSSGEKILCGINGGFFNFDGSSEHLGMYIDDGLYYSQPSINFVDFIYYKDGRTEVTNLHGYDKVLLSKLQSEANWAVATSYALVIDGKINLMLSEKFSHATQKQPRTMIGQKANGNFILAVADGRSSVSAGLTAQEQAQFMLDLGCINAVNLDGGGSSTMCLVENGVVKVANKPSDGIERKVGSVVLVKGV